jgi:AcrR family transcriptional regulator
MGFSVGVDGLSARQREILDAARDLLVDEGVEALTLGRMAQALGIKPPSLYKHFDSRRHIEALLITEGLTAQADALAAAGTELGQIAAAYRRFALSNPNLYRLMTEGPLPREYLPEGVEARAAAPLLQIVGDRDLARAVWAFAHGMVELELADRFPAGTDPERAWTKAMEAFGSAARPAP